MFNVILNETVDAKLKQMHKDLTKNPVEDIICSRMVSYKVLNTNFVYWVSRHFLHSQV